MLERRRKRKEMGDERGTCGKKIILWIANYLALNGSANVEGGGSGGI